MDNNLKEYYNRVYYGDRQEIEKSFIYDFLDIVTNFGVI
jgi:hypothetical protein